jgi:hypothetical protein
MFLAKFARNFCVVSSLDQAVYGHTSISANQILREKGTIYNFTLLRQLAQIHLHRRTQFGKGLRGRQNLLRFLFLNKIRSRRCLTTTNPILNI